MNVPRGHEPAKIAGVLRDKNRILLDAPSQDVAIRRTQPAEVSWVHGEMRAFGIQRLRDCWRDALIEKQPHRLV